MSNENELFGKRLAQLRQELAAPGESAWTRDRLAEATGLTTNQIYRLEQFNAGGVETFVKVLAFYHQRGYNTSWILLPDNSVVPKRLEGGSSVSAAAALEKLAGLKESLVKDIDDVAKYFQ